MNQIPIEETPSGSEPEADAATDSQPVEEQLRRLEAIVQQLETEAVSLDESISLFDEGVRLAVRIRQRLEASEGRIKQIIERSEGLFSLEDFDLQ